MNSDAFFSRLRSYPWVYHMTGPSYSSSSGPELDGGSPRIASGRQWLAIGGTWLLYWLIYTALMVLLPRYHKSGSSWSWVSGAQVLAMALFWTLATPLVFSLARRLRPDHVGWPRALALHLVSAFVLAVGVTPIRVWILHLTMPDAPVPILRPFFYYLDYNVITYGMLAIVGTAFDRYREYTVSRRRTLVLLTQLAEARLQFLQRQLQPHFLFNALNTVAELARESPAMARRTLLNLSRLLRSAIEYADSPEVTLREELATLEPFLEIQRQRFSDSLDISCDVSPDALDARVPPMLLQPLIENAVRHGRAGRGERGRVVVIARATSSRLLLRVEDDGARWSTGSTSTRSRGGHGIGLRNTSERLAQLYGSDHTFALRQEGDGTTVVELDLPYRSAPVEPQTPLGVSQPPDVLHGRVQLGPMPGEFCATVPLEEGAEMPAELIAESDESEARPAPRLSRRAWGFVALAWAATGVYWLGQDWVVERLRTGKPVPWTMGMVDLVSAVVWLALTPVVLWLARAVRLQRGRLLLAITFHLVAAVLVGALHLWICFSVGVDDRELLLQVNVNPFTLDLCIYFALLAWSHARDFTAWYEARGIAAARTETAIARSRVDATAIALHTQFLLSVLSSAASMAVVDPARTERVVERLGDLLRTVLRSVGLGVRTVRDEVMLLECCLDVQTELTGTAIEVHTTVDEACMGAYVPPGIVHAVMDYILARALAAPTSPLRVDVAPAGHRHSREIMFRITPLAHAVPMQGRRASLGHVG
jgi:two-component system LytT family sensor kinase